MRSKGEGSSAKKDSADRPTPVKEERRLLSDWLRSFVGGGRCSGHFLGKEGVGSETRRFGKRLAAEEKESRASYWSGIGWAGRLGFEAPCRPFRRRTSAGSKKVQGLSSRKRSTSKPGG